MLSPYARGYLHGLIYGAVATIFAYFILKALTKLGIISF
jgi:hypothetical protein